MLTDQMKRRAQRLGHSVEALERGELIQSTVSIPDIDELKRFLDLGTTPESRAQLVQDLFSGIPPAGPPAEDGSEAGILRRVEEFLFGNAALSPLDRERTASLFPMSIHAVSGTPQGPINYVWNLGTSANLVNMCLTTLDLEEGGCITIYNTPLQFSVGTLTRNGSAPPPYYDFNIFGATGSTGAPGSTGGTGGGGTPGSEGTCSSPGISGSPGGPGSSGTTGAAGSQGGQGGQGLPSLSATITIRGFTGSASSITVFTRSGTGGAGGPGGAGGIGGQGAPGGNGAHCGCEGTNGGSGGPGGAGGAGGTGGSGGNGVDAAANIIVYVPSGQTNMIVGLTAMAPPGAGGSGGAGGAGGSGGSGGSKGKDSHSGSAGGTGGAGSTGPPGAAGTVSGNPAQILTRTI